ncbi:4-(cytidine 5'-diphospho)-2-C-methyl-D-erythritol kinase [bacterium]|nr:4-(cytidine 5'-diphospho)-2-C-methyl-D-erythritol kinase [bacterium]
MDKVELVSYAKVNLTLEVSGKRADGYHEIDSIVQTIDITDDLIMTKAEPGVISVTCDTAGVPEGSGNIIYAACKEFFTRSGLHAGVECLLRKRIPMQAGLGGGSGNAAAAVAGLNRLYECGLEAKELAEIAAAAGSDAPLFIYGGTIRMRGRGEIIDPLPDAPQMHIVVVKPGVGVSTAWAYAELDKSNISRCESASQRAERAIRESDRDGLIAGMCNDFDPVVTAEFDEVRLAKSRLIETGAQRAMLSGSGSAVFGVFDTYDAARQAAMDLMGEFAQVFLTRTVGRDKSSLIW